MRHYWTHSFFRLVYCRETDREDWVVLSLADSSSYVVAVGFQRHTVPVADRVAVDDHRTGTVAADRPAEFADITVVRLIAALEWEIMDIAYSSVVDGSRVIQKHDLDQLEELDYTADHDSCSPADLLWYFPEQD